MFGCGLVATFAGWIERHTNIRSLTPFGFLLWISILFSLSAAYAQTGLPLTFSQLSNPASVPQLFYLDTDQSIPLGDKIPLVLVHGIDLTSGPSLGSAEGWTNFLIYFYNTPSVSSRYKIYRCVYQSNQVSVQTLGSYLALLLNADDGWPADQRLSSKNIVVLAHSMGGLVARRFMEEQRQATASQWNQSVIRLITLATPHHGTPAANDVGYLGLPPFAVYFGALGTYLGSDIMTLDYASEAAYANAGFEWFKISYNAINRSDLLWDNYDGLFTSGFSPGEQYPSTASLNAIPAQAYDDKIVAYAGSIVDVDGSAGSNLIYPGRFWDGLQNVGLLLANGVGKVSDGIVPEDSALFEGRPSVLQRRFNNYDHYQMMRSKDA